MQTDDRRRRRAISGQLFFSLDAQRFSENPRGSKSKPDWRPAAGVKVKLSSSVASAPAWNIRHSAIFNSARDAL